MVSFGIILTPDSRSKAYLQKIIKNGFGPADIIFMNDNRKEKKYSWMEIETSIQHGFDISEPVNDTLKANDLNYKEFDFVDINNELLIDYLKQTSVQYYVFSGGGILRDEILSCGKKFIHMHSGIVPEFRGSTCIYYSILDKDECGVTAFLMDNNLDTGDIVHQKKYPKPDHIYIDEIYDSYVRSSTLIEVLSKDKLNPIKQLEDGNTYFIIHPVLKHIAIGRCKEPKKDYVFPDEYDYSSPF